jgi:type IV pilus assembly protein PilA
MLHKLRARAQEEKGFTLIELLVVILIIGILAAIAIPSFLNQKGKAQDSQAKVVVRDAETAMETYATNNNGSYAGATSALLLGIDPTLAGSGSNTASLSGNPTGLTASTYTVVAVAPGSGNNYTIANNNGTITRTCTTVNTGGCPASGSW